MDIVRKAIFHDVALISWRVRDRFSIATRRCERFFRDAHFVVPSAAVVVIHWCTDSTQNMDFEFRTFFNQQLLHIVLVIVVQPPTGHLLLETTAQSACVDYRFRFDDAAR